MTALKTSVISMLRARNFSIQSVTDIAEVSIDIGLGVTIPGHEAAKFTRKQDSLHGLVVKREHSEQSFPYLLATQFCAGTVFGKDGEGIGAVMP